MPRTTPKILLKVSGSPSQAPTRTENRTVVEFRIAAREAVISVSANAMSENGIAALNVPTNRNCRHRSRTSGNRPRAKTNGASASAAKTTRVPMSGNGPMAGALFETAVFAEIFRFFAHRGEPPPVYFWRSTSGHEVDIVIELGGRVFGFEVKSTATPRLEDVRSLALFKNLVGERYGGGALVCLSPETVPLADGVCAIHFWRLC